VGRQVEQDAIRQELPTAKAGLLVAVTLEGERGIGKTRLLLAAAAMASAGRGSPHQGRFGLTPWT
jgi:hypothetical protein